MCVLCVLKKETLIKVSAEAANACMIILANHTTTPEEKAKHILRTKRAYAEFMISLQDGLGLQLQAGVTEDVVRGELEEMVGSRLEEHRTVMEDLNDFLDTLPERLKGQKSLNQKEFNELLDTLFNEFKSKSSNPFHDLSDKEFTN